MNETPREGRVTGLEPQKRHKGRTNVYVEGRFAFGVSDDVLAQAGLRIGDVLTGDLYETLLASEEVGRARDRALRLLATRERSRAELVERLRRSGHPDLVIDPALDRLDQLGYIDDRRFARTYADEKRQAGWGPRRISQELSKKGVDRSITERVMGEVGGGSDPELDERLVATLQRRFGPEFSRDPERARRRARGFLLRRGHEYETVVRLLGRVFGGGS